MARERHGDGHTLFATAIEWLAELYRAQGRYAEAEPLYKRSLSIREKALGPNHADVGSSLNNLAELYRVQSRYAEAEPMYRRSNTGAVMLKSGCSVVAAISSHVDGEQRPDMAGSDASEDQREWLPPPSWRSASCMAR